MSAKHREAKGKKKSFIMFYSFLVIINAIGSPDRSPEIKYAIGFFSLLSNFGYLRFNLCSKHIASWNTPDMSPIAIPKRGIDLVISVFTLSRFLVLTMSKTTLIRHPFTKFLKN